MKQVFDSDYFLHFGELFARHVLGRPVRITWTGCPDSRYGKGTGLRLLGQCWHDGDADVITLDPSLELNPSKAFDVFLHEIAHLRDHPQWIIDKAKIPQATIEKSGRIEDTHPKAWREREDRAEVWVKHWKAWSRKRAGDDIVERLIALHHWPGGVERGSPRHKLLEAYDAWRGRYHDRSTEHKVHKALNELWGDEPIVQSEDVALYKRTMALMGAKP